MAFFRGTGGSGESTTTGYASEIAADAAAAEASATAAASSASAAAASATAAASSESSVAADAATASSAATAAQTAQTAAETAQAAAEAAETATVNFNSNLIVAASGLAEGASPTVSYNDTTFTMSFGIPVGATGATGATGDTGPAGADGADGLGFTGGSYNASTGVVTFTSNDGLGFSTGDLRGADGGGLANVVEDTTPQLGGNLDLNGNKITGSGNIGVGTTSPTYALQIGDSSLTATPNGEFRLYGYDTSAATAKYGRLTIGTDGSFNIQAEDTYLVLNAANYIQSAKTHLFIQDVFQNNNKPLRQQDTGGSYRTTLITDASNVVNVGQSSAGSTGELALHAAASEAVRINSSGNVGIGTTTPSTKLDVNGVITATGGNSTNWNTAYGWGDHSTAGYLTGITGQSIENLSDVNTMTPTDGQVLTWDNTNSYWYAADAAGGSSYAIDETGRIETGNYIQFTNSGGDDRMFFKINDGVTTNTWGGFNSNGGYQFDLSTVNKKIIIEDGANGVRLIGYHKETGGNEGLEIHGIGDSATKSTVSIITNSNTGIRVTNGGVYLPSIPSTDPASTGEIWSDNGVVVMSGSTAPSGGLSTTSSSPVATAVTTLENLNSETSLNTKGDGEGYFVGPNTTDNTGFATSYSIFGLPAVSTPYYGGLSYYGTARTMVSGRNAIGLAIDGASAGLNSATSAFVVHNTSSTPVFKVAYGTGTTTTNNLIVDGSIEEQQYSLTGTDIDPANGTIQYKTLAANTTFTESLADGEYVILMIDDGAGYTITWPTITWGGGSAPTLATTGYSVIVLWQVNTVVYGATIT